MNTQELMTTEEAAVYLGVSIATFFRIVAVQRIPKVKLSPRKVRYMKEDLDQYLKECRR